MRYEGTVYRPPSEARSFILQVTIGCAHNGCTFCSMYKDKTFRIRKMEEIMADIKEVSEAYGEKVNKIFLADGDALIVPTKDLLVILDELNKSFPYCERITAYGAPKDVLNKTPDELKTLKDAGLYMVYMGLESGDDEILKQVKKGVTANEITEACIKLKEAGTKTSITLISGLGGRERLKEHALLSAKAVSDMKPDYLGFLTLMTEPDAPLYKEIMSGSFELLTPDEVIEEMEIFLNEVDSEGTVFRANHASNYLILKGSLNKDKEKLLMQTEAARRNGDFRDESWRSL